MKSSLFSLPGLSGVVKRTESLFRWECDLFFPPRCALCDADLLPDDPTSTFCVNCIARLAPKTWQGCSRCGGEIETDRLPVDHCPMCKDSQLWFDGVVPLGGYHAGLRDIVLRMKGPAQEPLSRAVGRLLSKRRYEALAEFAPDIIVPVPMYWTRWLYRGVNSPDILSNCIAKDLKVPVCCRVLKKLRNTRPQKYLKPKERFRNVAGAFGVRSEKLIRNARVLLVDDVLTTGATCSEAAKTLKEAGAVEVVVAVVARAQGEHPGK